MKELLTLLALCAIAAPAPAADLLAVYQRALQNDPQLREAEANRLAALESKPQALSALLPQLSGSGIVTRKRTADRPIPPSPSAPPAPPSSSKAFPSMVRPGPLRTAMASI